MSLRLPLQETKFATLINVYGPTLQAEPGIKEACYRDLYDPLKRVDSTDKLPILGDCNAIVGRDFSLLKRVIGKHGIVNYNDNTPLHLAFCSEHSACHDQNFVPTKRGLQGRLETHTLPILAPS